jgi:LemA protein
LDSRRILKQLYLPAPSRKREGWEARLDRARESLRSWLGRRSWKLVAGALIISGWIVSHVHYYNTLVELECTVHESRAQVDVQLQRRHHIRQNLAAIVRGYTRYEERVLTALTEMRVGIPPQPVPGAVDSPIAPQSSQLLPGRPAPPAAAGVLPPTVTPPLLAPSAPPPPDLKDLLAQLRIVAEQYPDLKLTQNLQQMSQSIIEAETEIAQRIMSYNDAVNRYTTVLDTFPGNVFGYLSRFPNYPFYAVDKDKLNYQEVSF